ncbi:MAG: putative maltokinase [Elusimicrobia bacterium]|nr:putative maltokinase [Elusimicrobiota bacterium]
MRNITCPVSLLPAYIKKCRWFGGKARKIKQVDIIESFTIGKGSSAPQILFLNVQYDCGTPETYLLPVGFVSGKKAGEIIRISRKNPAAVIAHVNYNGKQGIFYDAVYNRKFRENLFLMVVNKSGVKGKKGWITGVSGKSGIFFKRKKHIYKKSEVLKAEHSNTGILYGGKLFLKLYRRLDEGLNPDPEILRFLTEKAHYKNSPVFTGTIEYGRMGSSVVSIGMMHVFVFGKGDAWTYTLNAAEKYFRELLLRKKQTHNKLKLSSSVSPHMPGLIGHTYLKMLAILGRRTAELHLALSTDLKNPDFAPEPFSISYQQSVFRSMRILTQRAFNFLRKNIPADLRKDTAGILNNEKNIINRYKVLIKKKIQTARIRVHGDYHLGQVLYMGDDFVILDFEGEPARSLDERRLKRSPIRDIAGMIRSFHYVAYHSLLKGRSFTKRDVAILEPWADLWYEYVSEVFLKSYLETVKNAPFIPKDKKDFDAMLNVFLLEKAVYELGYELNNRPEWVCIPIKAIKQLTKT